MCDVMPTIPEDAHPQVGRDSQLGGETGNVEDMLLSMLDERDRLMVGLKEARDQLQSIQLRLRDVERERDNLKVQLSSSIPSDLLSCTRELASAKEELAQRNEEVVELKAERNNTRLLLEHLECLVARHERSLRMTVIKRHSLSPTDIPGGDDYNGGNGGNSTGISSEVEVLKALKSLFEHHKALDEKVRERLKSAITRSAQLEQELADLKANGVSLSLSDRKASKSHPTDMLHRRRDAATLTDFPQSTSTGNCIQNSTDTRLNENNIDRTVYANDNNNPQRKLAEMLARSCELEERLAASSREVTRANSQIGQLQRELMDSENRRSEQEAKVVSLDQKCLSAQREITTAQNLADKLRTDLAGNAIKLKQMEEKVTRLQMSLDIAEDSRAGATYSISEGTCKPDPGDGDYELATVAQFQQQINSQKTKINTITLLLSNAQEHIKELTEQLEDNKAELIRAQEREKLNEEHNERLSSTVDALLLEANERLQSHLSERMSALKQKRELMCEVERLRSAIDQALTDREMIAKEAGYLRRRLTENRESGPILPPLSLNQETNDPIGGNLETMNTLLAFDPSGRLICDQPVSATATSVVYSVRPSIISSPTKPGTPISGGRVYSKDQPVRSSLMTTKVQEPRLLTDSSNPMNGSNQRPFDSLKRVATSGGNHTNKDYANIPWSADYSLLVSQPPPMETMNTSYVYGMQADQHAEPQADPQTLASLIQHQLEVINDEIELIQEEKKNTDERANELRSRVVRGPTVPETRIPFATFENADSGMQMGCWSPTSSMHYSVDRSAGYSTGSLTRHRDIAQPQRAVYREPGDCSDLQGHLRPPPMGYGANRQEDNFAPPPPPVLPRRSHQPAAQAPKKHAYDTPAVKQPSIPLGQRRSNVEAQKLLTRARNMIYKPSEYSGGEPHKYGQPQRRGSSLARAPPDDLVLEGPGFPEIDDPTGQGPHGAYKNPERSDNLTLEPRNPPASLLGHRRQQHSAAVSASHRSDEEGVLEGEPFNLQIGYRGSGFLPHGEHMTRRQWEGNDANHSLPRDAEASRSKGGAYLQRGPVDDIRWQTRGEDLIEIALRARIPFAMWNAATVVAWLEHWVGMPAWYVAACKTNITCGGMITSLSDQEVQRELGISNPLHRLKLRVATQEMIAFTTSDQARAATGGGCEPRNAGSAAPPMDLPLTQIHLNHEWVGNFWLASLGLTQYRRTFMECLVDGRMLEHLTKRDLRVHLKVVDGFHRLSLQCGIALLKRFNYDLDAIEERREACQSRDCDMIVWTNDRVAMWLTSLDIINPNSNLSQSGLHGAAIALDVEMDTPSLAMMLQLPNSSVEARELLEYHLFNLVKPYRSLRLTYINLDNPAFTSDDRGEGVPWGDEETGEQEEEGVDVGLPASSTHDREGPSASDRFRMSNPKNLG